MTETTPKYTCLDLFSGAGGFSLGLEAAGFYSLGAIDHDPITGDTFRLNFGERPLSRFGTIRGDMNQVSAKELKQELEWIGVRELDLLSAGPPCQGFSKIGRGKLNSMAQSAGAFLKDERNQLYNKAIEMLRELKPRAFIFENVTGILSLEGCNMAEVVSLAVQRAGYRVKCALLNAAWYGVPQTRERVLIIGYREDLDTCPRFPLATHHIEGNGSKSGGTRIQWARWDDDNLYVSDDVILSGKTTPATTVGDAFEDLPVYTEHLKAQRKGKQLHAKREIFSPVLYATSSLNPYTSLMRNWSGDFTSDVVTDHFCRWTPRDFETFSKMRSGETYPRAVEIANKRYQQALKRYKKNGGQRPIKKNFIPPYSTTGFNEKWKKLYSDRPSWTVTAHLSKDTYSHIHFDSDQARAITPREAARLQSFPDGFKFSGNSGDMYRQVGNAVPPLLARALGHKVIETLCELDSSGNSGKHSTNIIHQSRNYASEPEIKKDVVLEWRERQLDRMYMEDMLMRDARPLLTRYESSFRRLAIELHRAYGTPNLGNFSDPTDEFVLIALSRKTNETAYRSAFLALKQLGPWEAILELPREEVTRVITGCGLEGKKAKAILTSLRSFRDLWGKPDLRNASSMPDDKLFELLSERPEFGPKSARCVMSYSFNRPAFAADAHVIRVLSRTGHLEALGIELDPYRHKKCQKYLEDALPPDLRYGLHVNLVSHGRTICTAKRPRCDSCPLLDLCENSALA